MKKVRQSICIFLTLLLALSSLSCFAGEVIITPSDRVVTYICAFDLELDSTFSPHPVYEFAEDGILHVVIYYSPNMGAPFFQFGRDENQLTVLGAPKTSGAWAVTGQWMLTGLNTEVFWDKISTKILSGGDALVFVLENCYVEKLDNPLDTTGTTALSLNMVEDEDKLTIEMYLYDLNGTDPVSTVAKCISSSFREDRIISADGALGKRGVFDKIAECTSVFEGTEEVASLAEERQAYLDSALGITDTETDDGETEEETTEDDTTEPEEPEETEEETEAASGINQGEDVPKHFLGLTKEESIQKYGSYYEDGVAYTCTYYQGTKGNIRYETKVDEKIEFTVMENFDGVSSNGKTTFILYETTRYAYEIDTGKQISHTFSNTLLQVTGNRGEKVYMLKGHAWRLPEGSIVSSFPDLEPNSARYKWTEIIDYTDEYMERIASNDDGDIDIHYSDSLRTGVESIELKFDELAVTVPFEEVDYIGGLLQYLLPNIYGEDWVRQALGMGLTPKESEAE